MKSITLSVVLAIVIIGGAFLIGTGGFARNGGAETAAKNVSIEDGKQIIELSAKGGYYPKESVAKAGIPTVLRVKTNGTFDCSSSIRIPSMSIGKYLPPSGTTDIDLGTPRLATVQGMCGMGMYSFQIKFQSS